MASGTRGSSGNGGTTGNERFSEGSRSDPPPRPESRGGALYRLVSLSGSRPRAVGGGSHRSRKGRGRSVGRGLRRDGKGTRFLGPWRLALVRRNDRRCRRF